ncbi:MAG: hypothetical protein AB7F65_10965 [Dehalococcoidia bacterium]
MTDTLVAEQTFTAIMKDQNDPEMMKRNKIHTADGGSAYGFSGALIGGVTIYGWCIPAILEAFGDEWLDRGWIYIQFRRPTYPNERVRVAITQDDTGLHHLEATKDNGEVCLRAELGMGDAPWRGQFILSSNMAPDPVSKDLEWLTLENAPVGKDIRTLAYTVTMEDARVTGREQIQPMDLFTGDKPLVHPSVIARHMITLLAHSYDYGNPSIHASSHIQNLARAHAGQTFTLTGHMIDAYEKNGHHYSVVDGNLFDESGQELARIRHTNIFRVAKKEG